mgnify:CR=1 FL=1
MSLIKYSSYSQYYTTDQTSWCLNLLSFRNIDEDPSDIIISLDSKYEKDPYMLAYDYYNNEKLWWVFMVVNPDIIFDPINDMVAGTYIRVPTLSRLNSVLGI